MAEDDVGHDLKEPRHDVAPGVKPRRVQEEPEGGHLVRVTESGFVLPRASNEYDSDDAEQDEGPEHRRGEARDDSRQLQRKGKRDGRLQRVFRTDAGAFHANADRDLTDVG